MYNVLLILLHRPFVADGHLHDTARSISVNSLLTCANAASQIVRVIRSYDKAFSVRRAPYLISYATYVSATILVRIAAKASSSSDVKGSLYSCIAVLSINQETNWAARRAKSIVEGLTKRLKVKLPNIASDPQAYVHGAEPQAPTTVPQAAATADIQPDNSKPEGFSPGLDIDAVIQSFVPAAGGNANLPTAPHPYQPDMNDQNRSNAFGYQNSIDYSSNFYAASQQDPYADWDNQFMPQGFQMDDLLFGFNGSMVDNF
jgi:hypothetical protein